MKPVITFDQFCIEFPNCNLIKFDEAYFYQKNIFDPSSGELIKDSLILNTGKLIKKPLGLNGIEINRTKDKTKVQWSSKGLEENYKKLISSETIIQLLDSAKKSSLIEIDTDGVLDSAIILNGDLTRDIKVSKPIQNYLRDLRILGSNKNFRLKNYRTGVEIFSEARSNKQRLIVYSKFDELISKKIAKTEIRKFINLDDFKDTLRVEANLKNPEIIRRYFNLPKDEEIPLKTILEHPTNVLSNYFNYMLPQLKLKKGLAEIWDEKISPSEFAKKIGMREIIKSCGFDRSAIRSLLKSKLEGKKNPSHYMKDYDEEILIMKSEMLGEKVDAETVEELRTKLSEV